MKKKEEKCSFIKIVKHYLPCVAVFRSLGKRILLKGKCGKELQAFKATG